MSRKLFATILKEIAEAPTTKDKVTVLQQNNTIMLRQLLVAATDPTVTFDVVIPKYRENEETDGYAANSLYVEFKRLYLFLDSCTKINATRKSALLAQLLESIDRSDALALIDVINKDVAKYGITKELLHAAFPNKISVPTSRS